MADDGEQDEADFVAVATIKYDLLVKAGDDAKLAIQATDEAIHCIPPLAPLPGNIQNGIEHLDDRSAHAGAMHGQEMRDSSVPRFREIHCRFLLELHWREQALVWEKRRRRDGASFIPAAHAPP